MAANPNDIIWTEDDGKYKPVVILALEAYASLDRRKKAKIYINNDPEETIIKGDPIPSPIIPITFPPGGTDSSNFFAYNEFTLLQPFYDAMEETKAEIEERDRKEKEADVGKAA